MKKGTPTGAYNKPSAAMLKKKKSVKKKGRKK